MNQQVQRAKKTLEEKRREAIAWLRERNLYVLDKGAKKPKWGNGKEKQNGH